MEVIIQSEEVAAVIHHDSVTFGDARFRVRVRGRGREDVWSLVAFLGRTVPDNPAAADEVALVHCQDDQGRNWHAFMTDDGGRGLFLTTKEADVVSVCLTVHTAPSIARAGAVAPRALAGMSDPNDDYRDPMEEPGAGVCSACGAYPLFPGERHECADA